MMMTKMQKRSRQSQVQFQSSAVLPEIYKPYAPIDDEKWSNLMQKEEDDIFIYRIREQLISRVMKECDKIDKQRRSVEFLVECSHKAWKQIIYLNFLPHQPPAESLEGPHWTPDVETEPCPPDTWSVNGVKVRRKPKPIDRNPSVTPVTESAKSEVIPCELRTSRRTSATFPTPDSQISKVSTPSKMSNCSKLTRRNSNISSAASDLFSLDVPICEYKTLASSEEGEKEESIASSRIKTPTSAFSLFKSCTKSDLPHMHGICDRTRGSKVVKSLGYDYSVNEEIPNGDADGARETRNVVKTVLPTIPKETASNSNSNDQQNRGDCKENNLTLPEISPCWKKPWKKDSKRVVIQSFDEINKMPG